MFCKEHDFCAEKRRKVVLVIACTKLQFIDIHSTGEKQRNQPCAENDGHVVRNAVGSVDLDPHPIRASAAVCVSEPLSRGWERRRRPCYAHRVLWWRKTTEKEIGIFPNTQRRRCLIWDTRGRGGEKRASISILPLRVTNTAAHRQTDIHQDRQRE